MSAHKKSSIDFLERLLNNLISTLFALMVLFIAPSFTNSSDYVFELSSVYFSFIMVFISGIVFQAVNDYFFSYKTKFLIHLRTLFFWGIIVLVLCFVFKMDYAPYMILPGILVQYILNALLNRVLLYQDRYLAQIEPWNPSELGRNLRSDSIPVEDLNKSIDGNKKILEVISIIVILYVFNICHFKMLTFEQTPVLFILFIAAFILFMLSVTVLFVIYNVYKQNTYFAFLGFKSILDRKYQIIKAVIPILALSFVLSFVFSSKNALIKFEYKDKNGHVYTNKEYKKPVKTIEHLDIDMDALREALPEEKESPFVEVFFKVFEFLILAAVAFALLSFMAKYIFTGGFITFFKEFTLLKIFKTFFQNIIDFFRELFGMKASEESYSTVNSRNFKLNIDNFLKRSKKSTQKKQELDKFTKQFMHIVEWGDKREIKYRKNYAPAEYCLQIMDYFNNSEIEDKAVRTENARLVGYYFEKALYSAELLSADEVNQFFINSNCVIESK